MKTLLTIAGFDPSSGAGVTADLMVFAAHRTNGLAAITALTVQSTIGVRSIHPVDPGVLRATLDRLEEDLPPAGIKIGMLGVAQAVEVVCEYLERIRRESGRELRVVLDPVLRSSSGAPLLDAVGFDLLRARLLPLVDWVTPNIAELAQLAGQRVAGREDVESASLQLQQAAPGLGVLATGGHLEPPDDLLVAPGGEQFWLQGTRVSTRATHGTGCALSSAFLCRLLAGDHPDKAARAAKRYVTEAMRSAIQTGSGPCRINHLWLIDNPEHDS